MKINKIIPIIPIAATSLVAPISITSCHPEYVEPIKMHNLLETYQPTSTILDPVEYNQTQATESYIYQVNNNPDIFYDDVCMAVQKIKDRPLETEWDLTEFSFGVSKPKFGETIVSRYGSNDIPYSTITAEQKFQLKYELLPTNGNIKTVWEVEFDVWYKDVVFYAYENTNTQPDQSKWNLGLFDYNIGDEAFWPFVSNLNPWSISYSCESVQTRYYVEEGQPDVLIDHKASYYSAMLDNGSKLLNLITYYREHPTPPASDDPMEWFLEHTAIEVMLIDYESRYFTNVTNTPEIRLAHILQSSYSVTNPSTSLSLEGLILILPTTITDPSQLTLTIINRDPVVYKILSSEGPMYQENEISIPANTSISIGETLTPYRYTLLINGAELKNTWNITPPLTKDIDLFMISDAPSISIQIKLKDGSRYPWKQDVLLPYSYCIHHITA